MKIAIALVVLFALTANAFSVENLLKNEHELAKKVLTSYKSLKDVIPKLESLEKLIPEKLQKVKISITKFVGNLKGLISDAEALYEDKKEGKTLAFGLKLIEAGSKFAELESEFEIVEPLFHDLVTKHISGAKSAVSELASFVKSIVHTVERRSIVDDVKSSFLKLIPAKKTLSSILSSIDEVKTLAAKYPKIYKEIKGDLPELEKDVKALLKEALIVAKDKKEGHSFKLMIDVASAGFKFTTLTSKVKEVAPELEDVIKESSSDAKGALNELEKLIKFFKKL